MTEPTDAEMNAAIDAFRQAKTGDECPLCKNGTVEVVNGEVRCRGECGEVMPVRDRVAEVASLLREMCEDGEDVDDILDKARDRLKKQPKPVLTARKLVGQLQKILLLHAGQVDYTVVFEAPPGDAVGQSYLWEAEYVPGFHELPHIVLKANPDVSCE